ncbi:MAG: phosphatidate cytidylyltransferase [Desulfobacterales bacterium]|nr:phosphatidate cytidylyltransferase [Desulfobacterales bacterium]
MHLKRWITSIIGLPILISLVFYGGTSIFTLCVCAACLISLWEYFSIVFNDRKDIIISPSTILAFIIGALIVIAAHTKLFEIILWLFILNLIISGFISILQFKNDKYSPEIVAKQILGICYIPLLISYMVLLRNGEDGIQWISFLFTIVFMGDVGAYYAGSYLGRHKLCPAVSPGKTIEGSIGGLLANIIVGSVFKYYFFPNTSWIIDIIFFIIIGAISQTGDLFESQLKRVSKIKDSGNILPGHGGILDRIDALLFACPVVYYFKQYLVI